MERHLADDEVVAFAGSLLTRLSDGRIPFMDHAVSNLPTIGERSSLVYFALPELDKRYRSFIDGRTLDIAAIVNELHQAFGNLPFEVAPLPSTANLRG